MALRYCEVCNHKFNAIGSYGRPCPSCGALSQERAARRRLNAERGPWPKFQLAASRFVEIAKQFGLVPPLDGSVKCADCDSTATCYDHRDYFRPMDVTAVCRRCNERRGPAKNSGTAPTKRQLKAA